MEQKVFTTAVAIAILAYFWIAVPVTSFGQGFAFGVLHVLAYMSVWATWKLGD